MTQLNLHVIERLHTLRCLLCQLCKFQSQQEAALLHCAAAGIRFEVQLLLLSRHHSAKHFSLLQKAVLLHLSLVNVSV